MCSVGGIEKLIDSVVSVMGEIGELYPQLGEHADADDLFERLVSARDDAQGIGWGYGDALDELVDKLERRRRGPGRARRSG